MVIAALLSFSSGIILDTLVQKHKQDFEFRLYITEKTWRELHKEDITRAECSVRNLVLENQYTGEWTDAKIYEIVINSFWNCHDVILIKCW